MTVDERSKPSSLPPVPQSPADAALLPRPRRRNSGTPDPTPPPVLSVSMRCSVGTTWTLVLSDCDRGGLPLVWISTGVPIDHPAPDRVDELLAEHGFDFLPAPVRCTSPGGTVRRLGFAWRRCG